MSAQDKISFGIKASKFIVWILSALLCDIELTSNSNSLH